MDGHVLWFLKGTKGLYYLSLLDKSMHRIRYAGISNFIFNCQDQYYMYRLEVATTLQWRWYRTTSGELASPSTG
jgi:hypothetical protein